MRKIFYTVFSISQICFLLLYPQEALAASKEGMQLWLNVLLPVLLPFLILTGILIHTNMAGKLLQPVEVIWNKVLGVSAAGAYAVIVGALCGYPVGAKITSDLYENHQISESEAKYLLTFTNHASPVFVRTYLCHICLKDQIPARTVFGIFALSDLTIMLLFRFVVYRNKIQFLSADKKKKTPVSSSSGAFLDVSIMNGFETVTRLGGYILMFSILSACISHFWNMKNRIYIIRYIGTDNRTLPSSKCQYSYAMEISVDIISDSFWRNLYNISDKKPGYTETINASLYNSKTSEWNYNRVIRLILLQDHLTDCLLPVRLPVLHDKIRS